MARTFLLLSVAAILITVAGSHEYLLAKGGKLKKCVGDPPVCGEGERFSRQKCACVPRGAQKELVCHLEEVEIIDPDTGVVTGVEVVGTVINVSVESAHIRMQKHGDCAATGAAGTPCTCEESTEE